MLASLQFARMCDQKSEEEDGQVSEVAVLHTGSTTNSKGLYCVAFASLSALDRLCLASDSVEYWYLRSSCLTLPQVN